MSSPEAGGRVLDIGCGFGDTTQRLAGLVGPTVRPSESTRRRGSSSPLARRRKPRATTNVRSIVGDVQVTELEDRFDFAFSRFGTPASSWIVGAKAPTH